MIDFVKRCVKAVFLLFCVFLLLMGAQGEEESRSDRQVQTGQGDQVIADAKAVVEELEWTPEEPYAQAYYDFLLEYISGKEAACEDKFSLLFIDEDEIPELLILHDNDSGTTGAKVYSCREGQVAELGEYGYDGIFGKMLFRERSGVVIEQFIEKGPDGGEHFYFYEIESGTGRELCHLYSGYFFSKEDDEYIPFWEIDGVSVQRDTFDAKWNELSDNQYNVFHEKSYSLEEAEFLPTFTRAIEDIRSALAIEQLLWKRDSEPVLEQVSQQAEVLAAYETVLDELAQRWSDTGRFFLIYLDDDDIPELVVLGDTMPRNSVAVYTYYRGDPVLVGNYASEGLSTYWEKQGIIFNRYAGGEREVYGVHKVIGTEDTLLQTFRWWWEYPIGGEEHRVFMVDEDEVSEAQYNEALQKWDNACEKKLDDYDTSTPIRDADIGQVLREELQTLILTQYDTLKRNLLIKAGVEEDAVLLMDYDDYDGDGIYEAFAFLGESHDYSGAINYSGYFWFVGADRCMRLPDRHGIGYRMIDGLMRLGNKQKYLYYHSDYCLTANISGIWTVENGKPVEVYLPQSGEVSYTGDPYEFVLWVDSYNHYYEPDGDFWTGHTWRPYFYHYDWRTGLLVPDESENLSPKELENLCGFDLAAEVEAEGYEVTAIVRWKPSNIVTINYTIPINEYGEITYENIVWDCDTENYWSGTDSWWNAGYGGNI